MFIDTSMEIWLNTLEYFWDKKSCISEQFQHRCIRHLPIFKWLLLFFSYIDFECWKLNVNPVYIQRLASCWGPYSTLLHPHKTSMWPVLWLGKSSTRQQLTSLNLDYTIHIDNIGEGDIPKHAALSWMKCLFSENWPRVHTQWGSAFKIIEHKRMPTETSGCMTFCERNHGCPLHRYSCCIIQVYASYLNEHMYKNIISVSDAGTFCTNFIQQTVDRKFTLLFKI